MENSKTKVCAWCGEYKPISQFRKKAASPDGYMNHCKECADDKTRRINIVNDLPGEKWAGTYCSPDKYFVSNYGRIKCHFDERYERIIHPSTATNGYLRASIHHRLYSVHRLVAIAFIDNPLNLPTVNHKNGDKKDNRIDNLEWTTIGDNVRHAHLCGLCRHRPVIQTTLSGEVVREWSSAREAAKVGGYCSPQITNCCRGKNKTHKGYVWRYKDNATA